MKLLNIPNGKAQAIVRLEPSCLAFRRLFDEPKGEQCETHYSIRAFTKIPECAELRKPASYGKQIVRRPCHQVVWRELPEASGDGVSLRTTRRSFFSAPRRSWPLRLWRTARAISSFLR